MRNMIEIDEIINSIQEIICKAKKNSILHFDELAYIFSTSKSESYIRDNLAMLLQKKYRDLIIAREYLDKDLQSGKSNERFDICVIERTTENYIKPLQIIELKNWYCHDIRQKKVWTAVEEDLNKINNLSIRTGSIIGGIVVVTFTHVMGELTNLHSGIIKYQEDIYKDLQRKSSYKYPEDILKYFESKLGSDFCIKEIKTDQGMYQERLVINYFYVISKK